MTSLRDAYPGAMGGPSTNPPDHQPPAMPAPHSGGMSMGGSGGGMVPHGPMGGTGAGSMDNKLPIRQIDGREPLESYLRPVQSEMPQYPYGGPGAVGPGGQGQEAAAAAAAQEAQLRRQQMFQAQAAAAEAKMRGIAKQENRLQAAGLVAIGMCVVFFTIFLMQMRGHVSFS